ncbi:MAG: response regulator, partial [Polyangiales bacterium]
MSAAVLIVDDERNIRATLRMILEGEGLQVSESGSGGAALAQMQMQTPDLVILDVRLPDMTGLEVLARMQKHNWDGNPCPPVVMISGHATVRGAVEAVQAGATDYFDKPLDRDRIVVCVRNVLRTRALELELSALREGTHAA